MPIPRHHLSASLTSSFDAIRERLGVPGPFPPATVAAARAAASAGPRPDDERADRRDLELVSIDPPGSRDLDQAFHLARRSGGFRFHYAIADVAAWVTAGDPVDEAARQRGATVYCPDLRVPLHPVELSEGAASLLPDHDAPAILWTIDLDDRGDVADVTVGRALVRNRRALTYEGAQQALDAGSTDDQIRALEEVGRLRIEREVERGGVSLELPEQSVSRVDDHYELRYDPALDVERWNAQLSLCCGMAAADLMVGAGTGIVRTLPKADPEAIDQLRRHSAALGVPWPTDLDYPRWVRTLDPSTDKGAALMVQAARTLRGSGYLAFDGAAFDGTAFGGTAPDDHWHHAIAAPYAHVTAPLRRLVDRFANECVLAAAAGRRPPGWVLEALDDLPSIMGVAGALAAGVERAVVDLAEAAALAHRVGETFTAVVTSVARGVSTVQLRDPAVIAGAEGELPLGETVDLRLVAADVDGPTVRFVPA